VRAARLHLPLMTPEDVEGAADIIEQLADISEAQRLAHELPYMRFMLPNQKPLEVLIHHPSRHRIKRIKPQRIHLGRN